MVEPAADTLREYRALRERYRPGLLKLAHGLMWRHGERALAFALAHLADADRLSDLALAADPPDEDAIEDSLASFWAWMFVTEAIIELERTEGRA
jgi:hypothetical protein